MNSSNSWRISNMSSCPKLRIEGFTDAWEQRKLSDIVDKAVDNRGKTPPISKEGTHPLIEVASLGNGVPDYAKVTKYLDDESFNTALRDYIKEDDILFSTVGSIGLVSLMDSREDAAIAQNIVSFRAKKNYDAKYIYAMFSTSDNQDKAWRIAMNGVQPSIKVSQLINVLYCVSNNFDEQKQIGEFFINLDNLITLHQRKSDALKNAKKYFLKNMFPSEGEKFPKLRLEGFTDAWEQRKLGHLLEKYEDPVETPHNGYFRLGIRSHAKGTFHSFVEPGKELETAKMQRVASDKFILNITFAWEHAVAITDSNDAGKLVSHRFPQFSFTSRLKPNFFKFLMLDRKFREYLELCSPGGAGRNRVLSVKDMMKYLIKLPSVEEQKKIGAFFENLDNLITLHQRKCDALKNAKKFFLQNMFV